VNESTWAFGTSGFGAYQITPSSNSLVLEPTNIRPTSILAPGFVDIHIHGGFGIDFMTSDTQGIESLLEKLGQCGYEHLIPTTVTASASAIREALAKLPESPMILGFHLEGPFVNPIMAGAQPKDFIINPPENASEWDAILDEPRLRVVTLAPELPGSLKLIQRLATRGVRVGIGHTNATYRECSEAQKAGATHTTHTFNAMRQFHHREAGTVGFALLKTDFPAELIYDRLHVCKEAASVLIKNKSADAILAVSDGTMASGMKSGSRLQMWGLDCMVGNRDVRLLDGTLAGSAITLLDAFQTLMEDFGPEIAIRSTSLNPRKLLGIHQPPKINILFDLQGQIRDIFSLSAS